MRTNFCLQVQLRLETTVQSLSAAAAALEGEELVRAESVPERLSAIADLRAMMDSSGSAVRELVSTAGTLSGSALFLGDVLEQLEAVQVSSVQVGAVQVGAVQVSAVQAR